MLSYIFFFSFFFLAQSSLSVAASDKDLQKRKASDPVMTGIFEEVRKRKKNIAFPLNFPDKFSNQDRPL